MNAEMLLLYMKERSLERENLRFEGDRDREFGSPFGAVGHGDPPAVVRDDPVGDGESEAGAGLLGGEERVEDGVDDIQGDAAAGVGDLHRHGAIAVEKCGGGLDGQGAAGVHDFVSVAEEIYEDVPQVLAIPKE